MEEPGGLQSMGSQRVGHNCVTNVSQALFDIYLFTHFILIILWDRHYFYTHFTEEENKVQNFKWFTQAQTGSKGMKLEPQPY